MAEEMNRDSLRESKNRIREERWRMRLERHAERQKQHCENMHHAHKEWIGIGVIVVGGVWLLNVLGIPVPSWLFSWPMLLVAIGLFTGIASRFHNFGSFILILIGLAFLTRNFFWTSIDLGKFIWPIVVIIFGILFLLKRRGFESRRDWFMEQHPEWEDKWKGHEYWHQRWHERWQQPEWTATNQGSSSDETKAGQRPDEPVTNVKEEVSSRKSEEKQESFGAETVFNSRKNSSIDDWLEVTTVFGGVRRMVISKNFKGGDLVNICGGSEIDLSRADINGTAVIDITNIWGGIRIAIPPNWQVRTNLTHIMAGVDESKRTKSQIQDPNKVLILTGVILMAGIEIRDFF